MTIKEFSTVLENHPNFPLLFEYQQGVFVRLDYHITEIKNVDFDTVDCGGCISPLINQTKLQDKKCNFEDGKTKMDKSREIIDFKRRRRTRDTIDHT